MSSRASGAREGGAEADNASDTGSEASRGLPDAVLPSTGRRSDTPIALAPTANGDDGSATDMTRAGRREDGLTNAPPESADRERVDRDRENDGSAVPGVNANGLHGAGAPRSRSTSPVRRLPPLLRPPRISNGKADASRVAPREMELAHPRPTSRASAYGSTNGTATSSSLYPSSGGSAITQTVATSAMASMPTSKHALPHHRGYYGRSAREALTERLAMVTSSPNMQMSTIQARHDTTAMATAIAATMDQHRGQKRRLSQTDFAAPMPSASYEQPPPSRSSRHRSSSMDQAETVADDDEALQLESRGSHGPRDETRYETWTSKQLRKKCSHLKLRGLKNVKKHVMVEALYRYYRTQRPTSMDEDKSSRPVSSTTSMNDVTMSSSVNMAAQVVANGRPSSPSRHEDEYPQHYDRSSVASSPRSYSSRPSLAARTARVVNGCAQQAPAVTRMLTPPATDSPLRRASPGYARAAVDEETKSDSFSNEIVITSEDVIRLVDVMLSHDFVDRLKTELSRWQFWVDAREKYIGLLHARTNGRNGDAVDRLSLGGYSRHTMTWSSMQLWEMWKELTFAYTKTCFEFTAAGAEERDYIRFCEGRPDVYYLHQRLHARPDLLHLIRSNEYIEEHCTSDGSDTMSTDKNLAATALMGVTASSERSLKRFKRIAPAPNKPYATAAATSAYPAPAAHAVVGAGASIAGAIVGSKRPARTPYLESTAMHPSNANGNSPPTQEEGSTENSETTGEDGSIEKSHTTNSSVDLSRREALVEQRYFGLLLQNFEAIFESLHNKKVLLAALRKDNNAPDHLIADLHDDIHVLSALKKEFRAKLRHTLDA